MFSSDEQSTIATIYYGHHAIHHTKQPSHTTFTLKEAYLRDLDENELKGNKNGLNKVFESSTYKHEQNWQDLSFSVQIWAFLYRYATMRLNVSKVELLDVVQVKTINLEDPQDKKELWKIRKNALYAFFAMSHGFEVMTTEVSTEIKVWFFFILNKLLGIKGLLFNSFCCRRFWRWWFLNQKQCSLPDSFSY
ncbi:unnamed protein product [Lactuca virosa]|uniref:Uncharacterized protein n=1 Tax=Lactuca virosa TaxID=75947 RepID=A0AAU9NW23_9ASTR|nr:unnamed protein product [Lactuca virosa]